VRNLLLTKRLLLEWDDESQTSLQEEKGEKVCRVAETRRGKPLADSSPNERTGGGHLILWTKAKGAHEDNGKKTKTFLQKGRPEM